MAAVAQQSTRSIPTSSGGVIRGAVSGLQQRMEYSYRRPMAVWDFRLDRWSAAGEPMPPVPVEMRGRKFIGSVSNGDWVEVHARSQGGKTLQVKRLHNLTSGGDVVVKVIPTSYWMSWTWSLVKLMVVIAVIVTAVVLLKHYGQIPGWK
jgi:hypothetical protein